MRRARAVAIRMQSSALKPPAPYAAAISPMDMPIVAAGVMPAAARRSVCAIWMAVMVTWPFSVS